MIGVSGRNSPPALTEPPATFTPPAKHFLGLPLSPAKAGN